MRRDLEGDETVSDDIRPGAQGRRLLHDDAPDIRGRARHALSLGDGWRRIPGPSAGPGNGGFTWSAGVRRSGGVPGRYLRLAPWIRTAAAAQCRACSPRGSATTKR